MPLFSGMFSTIKALHEITHTPVQCLLLSPCKPCPGICCVAINNNLNMRFLGNNLRGYSFVVKALCCYGDNRQRLIFLHHRLLLHRKGYHVIWLMNQMVN